MPARDFRASFGSVRIAFDRAIADAQGVVRGWRESARVLSLSAEHASRLASRAGLLDASSSLSLVAERAKGVASLSASEALEKLRDLSIELDGIPLPEIPEIPEPDEPAQPPGAG